MPTPSIEELLTLPVHRGLAVSPDGSRVLTASNRTGTFHAVEVLFCGTVTARTHAGEDAVEVLDYLPDGQRFLLSRDRGGDEIAHVHLCSEDGALRDLTPWDGVRVEYLGMLHDGSAVYVAANREDRSRNDLYRIDTDDLAVTKLYENTERFAFGPVSRDGGRVALVREHAPLHLDAHLLDVADGSVRPLCEGFAPARHVPAAFTSDGSGLYLLEDVDRDRLGLVRLDLSSGDREPIDLGERAAVDVALSREARYRATITDDEAVHGLVVHRFEAGAVDLPELPAGQIREVVFGHDERHLLLLLETPTIPAAPYRIDLWSGEGRWLVPPGAGGPAPEELVESEHRWFVSHGDLPVPGILYPAQGRAPGETGPGLIWVHGGPGGQTRQGFDPFRQAMALHGVEVFAVNNRGSSGYGKRFFSLDRRGHGDKDLDDCVAAKQVLIEGGRVDPARIGIAGGSYGGFLVLAALAFRPGEFACGVDFFGVSNLLRTQREIPPWWESFRQLLYDEIGDPDEDADYLRSISPLFHAERIDRPLIVLQGARDPRVVRAESDEIVEAVRANGVPCEYLVFEDEGHGFVKRANQLRGYTAVLEFLRRHLGS